MIVGTPHWEDGILALQRMEMRGLTCACFNTMFPPVPLCISDRLFVYLIPGDEGFVSVWVMDAGVIRSFWAGALFGLRTPTCRWMICASMSAARKVWYTVQGNFNRPKPKDNIYIYISTPNLTSFELRIEMLVMSKT